MVPMNSGDKDDFALQGAHELANTFEVPEEIQIPELRSYLKALAVVGVRSHAAAAANQLPSEDEPGLRRGGEGGAGRCYRLGRARGDSTGPGTVRYSGGPLKAVAA